MRVASKDERIAELEDKVEELESSIDSLRETVEMQQVALDQVSKDWQLIMEYLGFVSILSPSRLATEQSAIISGVLTRKIRPSRHRHPLRLRCRMLG